MKNLKDSTVRLQTEHRDAMDVATELTKALIEKGFLSDTKAITSTFEAFYNVAFFAYTNRKNPKE